MPTKTIIFLAAIIGIIVFIIIAIIVTVLVTGSVLAKNNDETRPNSNYLAYVKNLENFKCPKCGGELKLYQGKDGRTYYRCKDMDHCDYMEDPEVLINKK